MHMGAVMLSAYFAFSVAACADDTTATTDVGADVATLDDGMTQDAEAPPDVASPRDTAEPEDLLTDAQSDGLTPTDAVTVDATTDDAERVTDTSAPPSTGRIPNDTEPCRDRSYWPYSVAGGSPRVRVHYRNITEEPVALETLTYANFTLPWQIDNLGFRMAPSDRGRCGPDDALDIFLWRNAPETFTDAVRAESSTWWDDVAPYVVLDAFGDLGGQYLASTVTHELNHVLQAADSWYDSPIAYEMTAMYVEDVVYEDDNNYLDLLADFQASPELSLDYDDNYDTLYMYGACIYLQYLEARFFADDPAFIGKIWLGMRNNPDDNEPDLLDSLDAVLSTKGRSYLDTVLEFARWRYYTGRRDDGRHLPEGGAHPASAEVAIASAFTISGIPRSLVIANMLLGTTYVAVSGNVGDRVAIRITGAQTVQWVVQSLPGPADGDDGAFVLTDLGEAEIALGGGAIILAVTTLPGPTIELDPDTRSQQRYQATLTVSRAGVSP